MLNDQIILTAIDILAPNVKIPVGCSIDPKALLVAMTGNESSWGTDSAPRFEPGYYRGGAYYLKPANDWLRDLVRRYAQCAAMSWGPWQIMYPVAYELGYKGSAHAHPWGLYEPELSLHWVIEYLNRRVFAKGAMTVAQVGDAYNTGSCRDANHNLKYETDLEAHYAETVAALAPVNPPMRTT
jgi:hypothetical protein